MVHIQSATAEIRRGRNEERRRKKKLQDENIRACPIPQGGINSDVYMKAFTDF